MSKMHKKNTFNKMTVAATLTAIGIAAFSTGTLQAHTAADRVKPVKSLAYKSQSAGDTLTLDRYQGSPNTIEICLQLKNGLTWRKSMYIYAGPQRMIKKLSVQDHNTRDCTKIQTSEFAPKYARFELTKAGFGGVDTGVIHTGKFSVYAYDGMGFTINWEKD